MRRSIDTMLVTNVYCFMLALSLKRHALLHAHCMQHLH
jgi:hypothetical protein